MVAIVDYGMGNVASVKKALNFLKVDNKITNDFDEINESDSILLPGVGSFSQGMQNLKSSGLDALLSDLVLDKKKHFLGICLGMQLVAQKGYEPDATEGLGWISGEVIPIDFKEVRVPHMGWNNVQILNYTYFKEISNLDYYFIHSYHFVPEDKSIIAATVNYGEDIVAAIQKDNIFVAQFHPEKSQNAGIQLLKNYFNYVKS